jgi:predicted peroxiredoxin
MDIFIVSRDGSKQSIIANLATAIALRGQGLSVTMMYDQDAMIALAERKFTYSGLVENYQSATDKVINEMGFATDPMALLKMAKDSGVDIITCPIWAGVARTKNKIPSEVRVVELGELFKAIAESKKIMGGF